MNHTYKVLSHFSYDGAVEAKHPSIYLYGSLLTLLFSVLPKPIQTLFWPLNHSSNKNIKREENNDVSMGSVANYYESINFNWILKSLKKKIINR